MSYNEYLRDKKRGMQQIVSPTRIDTAGLFTQMKRYKAAAPLGAVESDGLSIQHKSSNTVLATLGNTAVCCGPVQETVTLPIITTKTVYSGWPALIVGSEMSSISFSEGITFNGNSVFVTGYFSGAIDLYNGGVTDPATATPTIQLETSPVVQDGFVAAYSKTGQIDWATTIETRAGSSTIGNSIAVDATGVYVTGTFDGFIEFYNGVESGTLNPDPGTGVASLTVDTGLGGLFIVKYSLTGVVQWVTKIENIIPLGVFGGPMVTYGICTSGTNLYVNAAFDICANVYNADGSIQMTIPMNFPSEGTLASLLAQYNTVTGTAQWATKVDLSDNMSYTQNFSIGLTCDANNVYMAGAYDGTTNYYNTVTNNMGILTPIGSLINDKGLFTSMFVMAYNNGGIFQWVNQADLGNNTPTFEGTGVRLAVSGTNLYAMTVFTNDLFVYKNPGSYTPVVKLTADTEDYLNFAMVNYSTTTGNVTWVNKITDILDNPFPGIFFNSCDIYADGSSLYVTGGFVNTSLNIYDALASSNPTSIVTSLNPASPTFNVFLIKYTSNGEVEWMTLADSPTGNDIGIGVGFDGNHIFLTGVAEGNIDFYNAKGLEQPSTVVTTLNGFDQTYSFIIEYDTNGKVVPISSIVTQEGGCCFKKTTPLPLNGYRPPRQHCCPVRNPPLGGGSCNCK